MLNTNRHPRNSETRLEVREADSRVITATVERAVSALRSAPLTGPDPLHNDERLCLFRVKRAIVDFFNQDSDL